MIYRIKSGFNILAGVLVASCLLASCSTSPTGRKQLTYLPESQMAKMGESSFNNLKSKMQTLDHSSDQYQLVECISNRILEANGFDKNEWEIQVFQEDSPNAFALPGKKIGVHTGMISLVDSNAQLAAVIGHEVGHVIADHGNERASQTLLVQGGLVVADLYLGRDSQTDGLIMGALGLGAQVGVLLPFSRKHEEEADAIGLEYMAKAGFNPKEASKLWLIMDEKSGGKAPPEFLSTHPSSQSRAKKLEEMAPQYMASFRAYPESRKDSCRR